MLGVAYSPAKSDAPHCVISQQNTELSIPLNVN